MVAGSRQKTRLQSCILPEPETRNGLSLARNDAFATITRSMLPPCSFASTPEMSTNPFDRNSFAQFGFEAETGRMSTSRPVIRRSPRRSCDVVPVSTPLWVLQPAGSKRSTGSITGSPLRLTPGNLSQDPVCVLLCYRSVNPGTESIMRRKSAPVNWNCNESGLFPQLIIAVFSMVWVGTLVESLCIKQRFRNLFPVVRSIQYPFPVGQTPSSAPAPPVRLFQTCGT